MSVGKALREFQTAMGMEQYDYDNPTLPNWYTALSQLRRNLIREEVAELRLALCATDPSLPDIVKEACDVVYVVAGLVESFGVDFDAAFAEVHRSNMSKLGPDGKPVLRPDGKILKGPNYSPADIESVIENQVADAA